MSLSKQQQFFKDSESSVGLFTKFARLPPEIRNSIWRICVKDYPARIIDLREYRRAETETSSPPDPPKPLAESQSKRKPVCTSVGFKSQVAAPALLYVCRDSRYFAREAYSKAFGTDDMPAETWIDFEKDILYLSFDFCNIALEGLLLSHFPATRWLGLGSQWLSNRFHTGRQEPYGYFYKELRHDIQKVKDLAISGVWNLGTVLTEDVSSDLPYFPFEELGFICKLFVNSERFTVIDAQHTTDFAGYLGFADMFSYSSVAQEDSGYEDMLNIRRRFFDIFCQQDQHIWDGSQPYPWFEFGILVDKQQERNASDIPPRKTGSRFSTEEDRVRTVPCPFTRAFLMGDKRGKRQHLLDSLM